VTFAEELAAWRRADEAREIKTRALEDREIRFHVRFREALRRWPDLLARLDEPIPWEERILQRREARAARRQERDTTLRRLFIAG
jgi:predicted nucleotidyltransferase component of viral defense system